MSNPKILSKTNPASLALICLGRRTIPLSVHGIGILALRDIIMAKGILYEGLVKVTSWYVDIIMSASAIFTSETLIPNETHDGLYIHHPPTKKGHHGVTSKDNEV